MANTITSTGEYITISEIDSDFQLSDVSDMPSVITIESIRFNGGAVSDRCVIKDRGATGPKIFDSGPVTAESDVRIQYYANNDSFHNSSSPFLDFSEGIFTAGATVTIVVARY